MTKEAEALTAIEETIKADALELWGKPEINEDNNGGNEESNEETNGEVEDADAGDDAAAQDDDGNADEGAESGEETNEEETSEESEQTEAEQNELLALKGQVKALTDFITSQGFKPVEPNAVTPPPVDSSSQTAKPEPVLNASLAEFLGELDIDEMQTDPNAFVFVLNKVAEFSAQQAIAAMQARLPTQVETHLTTQKLVENFYKENSELTAVKQTVGIVAQNVAKENPGFTLPQILEESGKRTRAMLGIKTAKTTTTPVKRGGTKPVIPGKTQGKRGSTDNRSDLAKEVQSLFNIK